jgi:undecaprenyl-diphosphatase
MSIFEAVVLGLIQGLSEFIPVSSSGHLLIAHEIFGSDNSTLAFDVALHVGTLLALFIYFYKDIYSLLINIKAKNEQGRSARLLIVATLPAAITGFLFSGFIDDNLRSPLLVAFTLAGVAFLMLYADHLHKKQKEKPISTKQGITVGFAQALALVPGVSRSGITITTGVLMGMTRAQSARFSFLLAIPIISGSALGILLKEGLDSTVGNQQLLIGVSVAFISGLAAIKFLLGIISRVGLKPFAYYRLTVATLILMFLV